MKVYVYKNFHDMEFGDNGIVINRVTGLETSCVDGWVVLTEESNYMFPPDVYIVLDKTEEE